MAIFKRIFLFVLMNILIVASFSIFLYVLENYFNIRITPNTNSHTNLLLYCLIFGLFASFASLFLSKWTTKWLMKLQPVSNTEKLFQQVKALAEKNNQPTPEVYVYNSNNANAFATGFSKKSSLVAFSTELLRQTTEEELNAIIAHELSHIKSGDMVTMTLIQGLVNGFSIYLAKITTKAISSVNENLSGIISLFIEIALQIVFTILTLPITMFVSRVREYSADYEAAKLYGKQPMINALKKLEILQKREEVLSNGQELPKEVYALGIKGTEVKLFASHPTIERRIAALQRAKELKDYVH